MESVYGHLKWDLSLAFIPEIGQEVAGSLISTKNPSRCVSEQSADPFKAAG